MNLMCEVERGFDTAASFISDSCVYSLLGVDLGYMQAQNLGPIK